MHSMSRSVKPGLRKKVNEFVSIARKQHLLVDSTGTGTRCNIYVGPEQCDQMLE